MDSSGVHALIASQRRATLLDKHLVLTRTAPVVQRLLALTGTSSMFVRHTESHIRTTSSIAARNQATASSEDSRLTQTWPRQPSRPRRGGTSGAAP
jgi:hypothetical protein